MLHGSKARVAQVHAKHPNLQDSLFKHIPVLHFSIWLKAKQQQKNSMKCRAVVVTSERNSMKRIISGDSVDI